MKMFTRHVVKQLSAYCNGELSAEQAKWVREHVLACERCRKQHDEIKLGVHLAQQLPMVSAPDDLWSEIEALMNQRSRKPVFQPKAPGVTFAFNWYRIAVYAAVLVVSVALAIGVKWYFSYGPTPTGPSWEVASLAGTIRVGGQHINDKGRLAVGETLETDSTSKAKINVGAIGEVVLDPNSRIRLLQARVTEHRLALDLGRMQAKISAPPKLFFVDTPSAEVADLGCEYTLEVDDSGGSLLHVTLGYVALVRNQREVWIPRYGMCQTRPGVGPGTPYFDDASDEFVRALEKFDFENGGEVAFREVLKESRARDTFTLWHLLSRVEGDQRSRVFDKMVELVGLPRSVTRDGVMRLDQKTLDTWKDELDMVWF